MPNPNPSISASALESLLAKVKHKQPLTPAEKLAIKKNTRLYIATPSLRGTREWLGLSIRDVAVACDISHTTIKNYEHGQPARSRHAAKLASFFGMQLKTLFTKLVEKQ